MKSSPPPTPLMVLGTSSGAGKSLMATALCRVLLRRGERPVPFKGQNMSNNAWVDEKGGEMAYSQVIQAWASGLTPTSAMNPVLLKPKGDSTSEVIHLGQSVGIANAQSYYQQWFLPGWVAIRRGLEELRKSHKQGRLVLEGAGSPVEINLKHRDLTNLRLAQFLRARCLLVADIERGGVFAQIIGTLALLSPVERPLVKGILINRFRGSKALFDEGCNWLESETGIPVLGVMPWIKELFPAEDSLDLIDRRSKRKSTPEVEIAVIKLPTISNFSDLEPLETEPTVNLRWVELGTSLGQPDAIIIPGSKQTIKDLELIHSSGLGNQIKYFAKNGGHIFGICGGMQMLGHTLLDPLGLEGATKNRSTKKMTGLDLMPIKTIFEKDKFLKQRKVIASWPSSISILGFELHHGKSHLFQSNEGSISPLTKDPSLGWVTKNKNLGFVAGTYLHGIFDNGSWRRTWLNELRERKGLKKLPIEQPHYGQDRDALIDILADIFEQNVDLTPLLKK